MTVFKVIGRMSVGDNTAIVVDGKGNLFHPEYPHHYETD